MANPPPRGPMQGRVLGLYALATLDREGSVYGYLLSERIGAKTDGAWRPGPGAIYPALSTLVERGYARSSVAGKRRLYSITPAGRAALRRIRAQMAGVGPGAPDLSLLWAEIAGSSDPGAHLIRHLRRHLDALEALLERQPDAQAGGRPLRDAALAELSATLDRLGPSRSRRARPGRRRPSGA
ncbi:MAG TPA: PadR family transcriptional regulator [Thermoplasmata archaeon]|nr:PadR family transcriptional regulator [Thermoplasmata archaeon]